MVLNLLGVCFIKSRAFRDGIHLMGGRVDQRRLISVVQVSHGPEHVCFVSCYVLALENTYDISHAIVWLL